MPTKKILLVIDQFEQWLHARRGTRTRNWPRRCAECDGGQVQAIVMVRDDFSVALLRFMGTLGINRSRIRISPSSISSTSDHATKVLTAFGQAFGALPDDQDAITEDQRTFLDETVAGLAQDGRVVSVRLALFAEMVKGDPWTPRRWKRRGHRRGRRHLSRKGPSAHPGPIRRTGGTRRRPEAY